MMSNKVTRIVLSILALATVAWIIKFNFQSGFGAYRSAHIIDYSPVDFTPRLLEPNFYSDNDSLRHSADIDGVGNVVFSGKVREVVVSPNGSFAAVFSNTELWLISSNGEVQRLIGEARSPHDKNIEEGLEFYRSDVVQWSRDSRQIYLLKDRASESISGRLFSDSAVLVRYDIQSQEQSVLVSPFKSNSFFVHEATTVYFSGVVENGKFELFKVSMKLPDDTPVAVSQSEIDVINQNLNCEFYFEFYGYSFREPLLLKQGITIKQRETDPDIWLVLAKNQELIGIHQGVGPKGPWNGLKLLRNTALGEYLLIDIVSASYTGTLIVNADTREYKEMGKGFRVYSNYNTCNTDGWNITKMGIELL